MEYAAAMELIAKLREADDAENLARAIARRAIDQGARAEVIAQHVGMSRTNLYRWMAGQPRSSRTRPDRPEPLGPPPKPEGDHG
jgi:transposase-like protein